MSTLSKDKNQRKNSRSRSLLLSLSVNEPIADPFLVTEFVVNGSSALFKT